MAGEREVVMKLKLKDEFSPEVRKGMGKLASDVQSDFNKALARVNVTGPIMSPQDRMARAQGMIGKTLSMAGNESFVRERAGMMFAQNKAQLKLQSAISSEMGALANVDKFGASLGPLVTNLGKLGPHAAVTAAGIGAVVGGLAAFHAAVVNFGGAADPYALERYNLAWADLQAVMGTGFAPILDQFTNAVRFAADALAAIMPDQAEFANIMRELQPVWNELYTVFADFAPLLKGQIVVHLRMAAVAMKLFADHITFLIKVINALLPDFLKMSTYTGQPPSAEDIKDGSKYRSVFTPPQFMGLEDLGKSNILSSFAARNPADQTAENTRRSADALDELVRQQGRSDPAVRRGTEGG